MKRTEIELLAAAITNRERLDILMEQDPGDLFTYPDTLAVLDTLREMTTDGMDPDLATLSIRFQDRYGDKYSSIIYDISTAYVTPNFLGLIKELKRHHRKQHIQDFAKDLYNLIRDGGTVDSAAEMLATFQDELTGPDPDVSASMKDLAKIPLDELFTQHSAIPTGIEAVDAFIPGLYPGQLVVKAARPGMGKTSLAIQAAGNLPGTVLFFSLEMSRHEIFARRLSMMSNVEGWKIETKKINDNEARRVFEARDKIIQLENDIVIIDRMSDVSQIINTARRFIRRGNVSAVFIDYLQLMAGGRGETQNLRIADITRRLKLFAMENAIPVVLLSQLNRAIEHFNREPVLSDLRDSGAIEQDADVVMFIHEIEYEDGEKETNLIFAKNRKGRTGKTLINFVKRYTRFEDKPATDFNEEVKSVLGTT